MKTFSWSRYDSLRLDPEPGTSIWDYEIEEEPEPDAVDCAECEGRPPMQSDLLYFDDEFFCEECFTNNLCGWEGQIWPLAA